MRKSPFCDVPPRGCDGPNGPPTTARRALSRWKEPRKCHSPRRHFRRNSSNETAVTFTGITWAYQACWRRWRQSLTLICLRLGSFNMLSVSLCVPAEVPTLRNNPSSFVCLHKVENLYWEGVSPSRLLYWLNDIWVGKTTYQLSHEPKFHLIVYEQFPGEQPSFVSPNEW